MTRNWLRFGLLGLFDWQRPFLPLFVCLVVILLLGGLPVLCVMVATGIAGALGCTLNETDAHPCLFHGADLGDFLYTLFVSGWFGLLTIPVGAILLLVWLGAAVAFFLRHLRAGRHSGPV